MLVIIVFFSFLTFYSAYTGEVTDCGCFGDAIKLTPWESFAKDMILLVLILILFLYRKSLKPLLSMRTGHIVIAATLLVNLILAIYAIRNLPFIDFRAYRIGVNIPKAMQPSEPLRQQYLMEKDGEIYKLDSYPTDTSYHYKDMILLNPEAQPKITDYNIWSAEEPDATQQSFEGSQLIIVVHYAEKAHTGSFAEINQLISGISGQVGVMVLTASDEVTFDAFRHEVQLAAPFFSADATVLKTMVRSNPGLLLLKNGVILGKWHHRNVPSASQVLTLTNR